MNKVIIKKRLFSLNIDRDIEKALDSLSKHYSIDKSSVIRMLISLEIKKINKDNVKDGFKS